MITAYLYGEPFDTEAVVEEVPICDRQTRFTVTDEDGVRVFRAPLAPSDAVYGLGQTMRGINKRGGRYVSFNCDDPRHNDEMPSMYGSHNFFVVDGAEKYGAFFDTPARAVFEIGFKGSGEICVRCERDVKLYIIDGESAYAIVRRFLRAIGRSFVPPLWAFGFGQSRWGYKNEKDIEKVLFGYRKAGIPLDYICMDIDYMDRYIDFTLNKRRFPNFAAFNREMKKFGIRLVPIVDAAIKEEKGEPTYEEGVQKGYFCKNREGGYFRAAVWPGMTHLPDFLRPEVRKWFGRKYKVYTDCGVEGFWNDMNEPSIFYSEYTKNKALHKYILKNHKEDPDFVANGFFSDYASFYHEVNGKKINHYDVHNVYGYMMTRASCEGLSALTDKRFLLFSRSSYIGAHRYGGMWTGDNTSCWAHLRQNLLHMPSLNTCGFLFSGADTGGFMGNCDRELLLRWLALSVFTPLMRDHTSKSTRRQECYRYGKTEDFVSIVSLRYKLLPYIYSEFMKAVLNYDMYFKPLAFVFPEDRRAAKIEDQMVVGGSMMIAPFMEKGKSERTVYLPEPMTCVKYDGNNFLCRFFPAGEHIITAELHEVVFFVRKGKLVPVGKGAQDTSSLRLDDVELLGDGEQYELYADDGYTRDVSLDRIRILKK